MIDLEEMFCNVWFFKRQAPLQSTADVLIGRESREGVKDRREGMERRFSTSVPEVECMP